MKASVQGFAFYVSRITSMKFKLTIAYDGTGYEGWQVQKTGTGVQEKVETALAKLFPTAVRYTGTSLTFNIAGILGASLAPPIATVLALRYGIAYVGYYLSGVGIVTLIALANLEGEIE